MMVLRQEDADQRRSQHRTAAQRPTPEGSPESRRSTGQSFQLPPQRSPVLARRFEAKLRCQPEAKVAFADKLTPRFFGEPSERHRA